MRTEHLTQLARLDPPYLNDFKDMIDDHLLDNISTVFGKICNYASLLVYIDLIMHLFQVQSDFRKGPIPSGPPTSPDIRVLEFSVHPILRVQDQPEHLQEPACSARNKIPSLFCLHPNNP